MTPNRFDRGMYRRQQGATLVVAMIMLVLITIVGFNAMQTTILQERMSGNLRDKEISFQAAEAALREQEAWLQAQSAAPALAGSETEYGTAGTNELGGVSADPLAQVEHHGFIPDSLDVGFGPEAGRDLYRIEARGFGQSDSATSTLESLYAKRFN